MDSHFADAASDRSNVSGIAERQPIDPGEDFCLRSPVSQVSKPVREFVGSLDCRYL
jgi:hypothetical protein